MAFFTSMLLFLLSTHVLAAVVPDGPAHVTSSIITTLTILNKCYTKTINSPNYNQDHPSQKYFPPIPQCVGITKTTVTVPPINPECKETPTIILPGPIATYSKGCAERTSTIWETAHIPAPSRKIVPLPAPTQFPEKRTEKGEACKRDAACATTVFRSLTQQKGLTYTYHPLTQTVTSLVACKGCDLVVSEVGGAGPAVSRSVTVTDTTPDYFTVYACQ